MTERWRYAPGGEGVLRARGLVTVAHCLRAAARAPVLSRDSQSAAVVLDGDPPLLLKWRRVPGARRARTLGRRSRERREFDAAQRIRDLGLATPDPLGVGERRALGLLLEAVLVRPYVASATDVAVLLARGPAEPVATRFAQALADWHRRGLRHGNAYPRNVLLPDDGGPPMPVGFPAASFGGDRARWKDVAQAVAGVLRAAPDVAERAWIEAYAAAAGLPADEVARRVAGPLARVREKRRRDEARRAAPPATP